MIAEASTDFANLTAVGIGTVLLALVFRTLWRQEGGWRAVLDSSREDAKVAREDAATARTDAAEARIDAREARSSNSKCHRQLAQLEDQVGEIRAAQVGEIRAAQAGLDVISGTPSGEFPITDPPAA